MAPTLQQVQSIADATAVSSLTYSSFAVGSGANRSLVAVVIWRDDSVAGDAPTVSSVVFNTSENFTRRANYANLITGDNHICCEIWTLDNPTNTTANVVATLSEANSNGDGAALIVLEYTGANNGVGAATNEAGASATAKSIDVATTSTANLVIAAFGWYGADTSGTEGDGVTERYDDQSSTSTESGGYVGEKAAGASGTTVAMTLANSRATAECAIELKAAAAGTNYPQSAAGSVTPAGAVVNKTGKPVSGALTSSGALINKAGKVVSGALTSAGSLTMRTGKVLAGALSPDGAVAAVKTALVSVGGTLTSAGALVLRTGKVVAGSVAPDGSLVRNTGKIVTGALGMAGEVVKRAATTLAGELTSSGVIATVKAVGVAVGGTLTSAGTLVIQTGKVLAGTIAPDGGLIRNTAKALTGALTSSGIVTTLKATILALGGTLISSGAIVMNTSKALAGTLAPDGGLVKRIARALAGILTSAGSVVSAHSSASSTPGTRDVLHVEARSNLEVTERATLHVPARKDVIVDN